MLEEYERKGCTVNNIRILGGASRSKLWMDIFSSVVDRSVIKFKRGIKIMEEYHKETLD